MTAEATGAREALTAFADDAEANGRLGMADEARAYRDLVYPAPTPAPRRVRAEVQSGLCKWVRCADGSWDVQGGDGSPHKVRKVRCAEIAQMAALDARADAEGMVDVDDSILAQESHDADSRRCKRSVSDDPPASRVAGQSDAPSPQNGAQAVDCSDLMPEPVSTEQLMTWGRSMGGGDTSHMVDDPTPSASPEDVQSPSRAAQETADGRVWWLYRTAEGWRADEEPIEPDAIPVVPRWALEAERRALGGYKRDAEEMTRELAQIVCGENEDYVPRSALARVQRERDEAVKLADMRKEALAEVRARNVQLRAEVQRMELVRDDALRREQSLRAERAAALDRARVAEQRIENGDECWHFTSPSRDVYYPYNVSSSDPLGRCTRGRFVADTENGQ